MRLTDDSHCADHDRRSPRMPIPLYGALKVALTGLRSRLNSRPQVRPRSCYVPGLALGLAWGMLPQPVLAQDMISLVLATQSGVTRGASHFGQLVLEPVADRRSASQTVAWTTGDSWTTGGMASLTAISNFDDRNELCSGYSYNTQTPDHILHLTADFDQLRIGVESGGEDTTLVIEGPQGTYCGDDGNGDGEDASIGRSSWRKGTYRIWVGTADPGQRYSYRLKITQGDEN